MNHCNENHPDHITDTKITTRKLSPFGHLFRFLGRTLGFASLYAAFSVCPFCGQQGCPVGVASAGAIGAFLALCLQDWKTLFQCLKERTSTGRGSGSC